MKFLRFLIAGPVIVMVSACQTTPLWNHPNIHDPSAKTSRLTADDTECMLAAEQYNVSLPVPGTPQAFTATGRTYNPQSGTTTVSSYSGQIGGPSGGFAGGFSSGFSNGAALGAAIRAARLQDKAYRYCMTSRGWVDENSIKNTTSAQVQPAQAPVPLDAPDPYPNAIASWEADAEEFLRFFPEYKNGKKFNELNTTVKKLAETKKLEGSQYLVEALQLIDPNAIKTRPREAEDALDLYLKAVRGNARAQAGLSLSYVLKKDPRTPDDVVRASHWTRKSALAGNAVGMWGYGTLLVGGAVTGKYEKVLGYRWIQKAGKAGAEVRSALQDLESLMTQPELAQVKQ